VWIVIGTRPEAIKLAPVVYALEASGLTPLLVITGQHPALDLPRFGLAGRAVLHLGCAGMPDPHAYSGAVSRTLAPLLAAQQPSLLLVQGDTSSALGGALAGFLTQTPVGHVEAGLRTFDPAMPCPKRTIESRSMPGPTCCSRRPSSAPPTSARRRCREPCT
jgi:UDP-N-acetylglucosamine 2-epimerase (non-hydrolysing)